MEEGQQSRFVCKLCNKRFPSGKSFGGHMRSHVVSNSTEPKEKLDVKRNLFSVSEHKQNSWEFGEGQSDGYGLRENPKRTWRAADSRTPSSRFCEKCGKEFQSVKALCGHMSCHSYNETSLRENSSWTSENNNMVMDGFSDTESCQLKSKSNRRSSMSKKQMKSVEYSPFSSVFYIDDEEEENIARCLMLLSKDEMNKHSVVEYSDNNSVVLEAKSSSIDMKMSKGKKVVDEFCKKKNCEMEDSDSWYFLDEVGDMETDEDVKKKILKRFQLEDEIESRKKKFSLKSLNNTKFPKKSKFECFNCKKIFKSYHALGGHRPCKANQESNRQDDDQINKHGEASSKNKKVHVCPFCDRVFKNGQALGGHKRSHFINSDNQNTTTSLIKLDLNLPAPEASQD